MSNTAFFLKIYFIGIWITASFASCLNSITCPCGSSKINYTHCIDAALHKKYSCERWTNCQTCKANSMDCVTCPPSRFGPICTEAEEKITEGNHVLFGSCPQMKDIVNGQATCIRKENIRQCKGSCLPGHRFAGMEGAQTITLVCSSKVWVPLPQFPPCIQAEEKSTEGNHVLFGSCPQMKDIVNGQATCIRKENIRQCQGSCLPGHSFAGMEGAQTITLVCSSNIWVPLQQFPPCKPEVNRYCDLRLTGPNQAYCIDKEIRRDCDITCDGKFQGRYSCSPGQTWTPPLPYCVHPTDCQDPGIPEGANRTNANGFDDSLPRTYREGESVHFSCKEKDSLLHGPEIITCGSNATWSNSLPRCEGYRLD